MTHKNFFVAEYRRWGDSEDAPLKWLVFADNFSQRKTYAAACRQAAKREGVSAVFSSEAFLRKDQQNAHWPMHIIEGIPCCVYVAGQQFVLPDTSRKE